MRPRDSEYRVRVVECLGSILAGFKSNYASIKLRRIMRATRVPPCHILTILHDIVEVKDRKGRTWIRTEIKGKNGNSNSNAYGKNVRIYFIQSNIY